MGYGFHSFSSLTLSTGKIVNHEEEFLHVNICINRQFQMLIIPVECVNFPPWIDIVKDRIYLSGLILPLRPRIVRTSLYRWEREVSAIPIFVWDWENALFEGQFESIQIWPYQLFTFNSYYHALRWDSHHGLAKLTESWIAGNQCVQIPAHLRICSPPPCNQVPPQSQLALMSILYGNLPTSSSHHSWPIWYQFFIRNSHPKPL